jgi:hypothetical protein
MIFIFLLLLLFAIGLLTISAMPEQRQRIAFQAIAGGLEALTVNILLYPLIAMLLVTAGGTWHVFIGLSCFYVGIQLLYITLRSRSLRRQHCEVKLKGLIAGSILIVISVYLFIWWVQSQPWEEVFPT